MKHKLLNALTAVILLLIPNVNFAQAPTLGTAANFVLFSSAGAVTNSGISLVTGNVGTNSGSSTGFGNVNGQMHDNDGVTGSCTADLLIAYGQLNTAIPTFFPSPLLGNGDTLIAGVYYIPAAATMNLNLFLDAKGNPSAVFIFQIQGAFSTGASSKVKLINGAQACNVFWKVEGLVSMAAGTTMRGTVVAHNAAINMNAKDTLEGRALSIAGAVTVNGVLAYTPTGCGSPTLTGPAAPALASTACYALFSADGPVSNSGVTNITGDIGTNVGLTTGFNPLFVAGTIHPIPDGSTVTCAADLHNVYTYLNTLPSDIELLYPAQFGHNLVLTPHTYIMKAATTFTDTLYLDGEGNAGVVFVIQINGAISTSTFSRVMLINGTQAKNVFWKVDGAVNINDYSVFNGTIICNNAAISINTGATINGRALTTTGALTTMAINVIMTPGCGGTCIAPAIGGSPHVCIGLTTTLSNTSTGGTWSSSNTATASIGTSSGVVTGKIAGTATITYTLPAGCTSTLTFTVNPLPSAITGPASVCAGATTTLSDAMTGGTWSSSNTLLATAGTGFGTVTGVAAGTPTITYSLAPGCSVTKTITVSPLPNAGSITGVSNVCAGSAITLTDVVSGGLWSTSNAKATVTGGVVTGVAAGTDTIRYTVTTSGCSATATKTVAVSSFPLPGSITGASGVCVGAAITLTDIVTGGVWNTSNAKATVSGGVVTGITAGTDTIIYSVTNVCGTANTTKTVTINPLPGPGSITGASDVCVGLAILLSDGIAGGVWSSSNTKAKVASGLVTGITAGADTIIYTVINGCGTATATKAITVSSFPVAGSITGLPGVCVGAAITLTDGITGGIWSSSNANASVLAGVVTGVSAGMATISYSVINACGTANATLVITINPLPNAGTITGEDSVCVGNTIILTDLAGGGIWNSSNTSISVISGSGLVSGISAGIITIVYSVSNSCGIDVAVFPVKVISSLVCSTLMNADLNTAFTDLNLYPNPNQGTFTVNGTLGTPVTTGDAEVSLEITNMLGQVVYNNKVMARDGIINEKIQFGASLANGIYILNVKTATEHKVFHFALKQ